MPRLTLTINGREWSGEAAPDVSLLDLLRSDLRLTGAKYGCGEGQCGSCTVLVDRRATPACMVRAVTVDGRRIDTIEGLSADGALHPVQRAFLDAQAFQCGFCTPGMILGVVALLEASPRATEEDVLRTLESHLCRCGTYPRILEAARAAAKALAPEVRRV